MPEVGTESRLITVNDFRINFRAIFTGTIVALALQMLLHTLGQALGLSLITTSRALRPLSIGLVLWALLIPFATFWLGGLTASLTAKTDKSGRGVLHGFLVWGLSMLFVLLMFILAAPAAGTLGATGIRATVATYWLVFFSACSALAGAVSGGYLGSLPLHRSVYGRGDYYRPERPATP